MYLFVLNILGDVSGEGRGPSGAGAPDGGPDEEHVQRWVALARGGDSLAARRLYRTYAARLFRTVRPLLASDADAEDVVQDAFLAALGSLGRYEARPGTRFLSWLVTIGLNAARKQVRRTRRWRPLPSAQDLERRDAAAREPGSAAAGDGYAALPSTGELSREADRLDEAIDRRRQAAALLEALAELPERDRRVVVLRYGAELDATEIGRLVGEAPATVRKICQRQRERLLERLGRLAPDREAGRREEEVAP